MKDYIFAININKTGETGIINTKTIKVLCLCPKENAEIILKSLEQNEELVKENLELRKIAQQAMDEREVLIKGYDAIRKLFKGRDWLMEGRGCYPYNDDRYKQEVRYIMDDFNKINANVWKNIKSKYFEYRNYIEKPLLEKIKELENQLNKIK